jgi:hypothetical protein
MSDETDYVPLWDLAAEYGVTPADLMLLADRAGSPIGRCPTSGREVVSRAAIVGAIYGKFPEPKDRCLLKVAEAADLLGVPSIWLKSFAQSRRIPHVRIGGGMFFEPRSLLAGWRAVFGSGDGVTLEPAPLLTVRQAARRWSCRAEAIEEAVKSGRLRGYWLGKRLLVDDDALCAMSWAKQVEVRS